MRKEPITHSIAYFIITGVIWGAYFTKWFTDFTTHGMFVQIKAARLKGLLLFLAICATWGLVRTAGRFLLLDKETREELNAAERQKEEWHPIKGRSYPKLLGYCFLILCVVLALLVLIEVLSKSHSP